MQVASERLIGRLGEPLRRPPMPTASSLQPDLSTAAAVLRGATRGLAAEQGGFRAAELWRLDDEAKTLRLAERWGADDADHDRLTVRLLANATADVAALAGGAVALESAEEIATWDLHEAHAGAALCLPVASATTIHGVMWLFADHALAMSDEMVELAEVVAGRLALEIENAELGSGKAEADQATTVGELASELVEPFERSLTVAAESMPTALPLPGSAFVAPVEAAGWTEPHADGLSLAGCWELEDGRLLSVAAAAIDSPESTEASQRAAIDWLGAEAPVLAKLADDAGDLMTWLNRGLIESPLAGEGLAATVALVDAPEDAEGGVGGIGTYAVAGPTVGLNVRAATTESHAGDLVPLGWSEPDAAYAPRPFELAVRQRLVLVAGDPRLTSPLLERQLGDAFRAATADAHREMTPERCLRRVERSGVDEAWAAVAIRRI